MPTFEVHLEGDWVADFMMDRTSFNGYVRSLREKFRRDDVTTFTLDTAEVVDSDDPYGGGMSKGTFTWDVDLDAKSAANAVALAKLAFNERLEEAFCSPPDINWL